VIDSEFALADAQRAFERLMEPDLFGKVTLTIG
jgi:hypothetical protein